MATPNYGYEKRQRELAKKKKKEDKLRAKSTDRRPEQGGYAQQAEYPGQQQSQGQQLGETNSTEGANPSPASPQSQTGQ